MSPSEDHVVLTERQQRTMEVLAKFYRLNPNPVMGRGNATLNIQTLRGLEDLGLVHTSHGLVVRTYRVFLTELGQQVACGMCFDQGRRQAERRDCEVCGGNHVEEYHTPANV